MILISSQAPSRATAGPSGWHSRSAQGSRTLERLLAAAEELLEDQHLDALRIGAITERAGCSVGSFYNYFEDKRQLLQGLLLRFRDEHRITVRKHVAERRWEGIGLAERLESLIDFALRLYSSRRGSLRAMDVETRLGRIDSPSARACSRRSSWCACTRSIPGAARSSG